MVPARHKRARLAPPPIQTPLQRWCPTPARAYLLGCTWRTGVGCSSGWLACAQVRRIACSASQVCLSKHDLGSCIVAKYSNARHGRCSTSPSHDIVRPTSDVASNIAQHLVRASMYFVIHYCRQWIRFHFLHRFILYTVSYFQESALCCMYDKHDIVH